MMLQKKRITSILIAVVMMILCVLPSDSMGSTAKAATSPKLSDEELTIGIGTYGSGEFYYHKINDRYDISVKNPEEDAVYTFTTSDSTILGVNTEGTKAYLTGIKKGTANITCEQTLDGDTTEIGVCTVTVNNAYLRESTMSQYLVIGTQSWGSWVQPPICYIMDRIPDAEYTYTINSKNLTMKDTRYEETQAGEGCFGFKQTYTATKAGTYTVKVNEVYNKQTRYVGSFEVVVNNPEVQKTVKLALNDSLSENWIVTNQKTDMNYYYEGVGFNAYKKTSKSVAYIAKDKWGNVQFYGCKIGSAKFKVYEGTSKKNKKLIGYCTIKVSKGN